MRAYAVPSEKRAHHIGERLHDVGPVSAEVGERFAPRLIGRRQFVFAPSVQDEPAGFHHACRRLAQQRRLADAGFAGHERDAMAACLRRVLEEVEQGRALRVTADEGFARHARQAGRHGKDEGCIGQRFPLHCARQERRVEPLQFERADGLERVLAARAGECAHDVGGEDLPRVGARAQPGGFDDGTAEVVVAVPVALAHAQADAEFERNLGPPVADVQRLLQADGGVDRRARGAEHDHQTVARVLHLDPVPERGT